MSDSSSDSVVEDKPQGASDTTEQNANSNAEVNPEVVGQDETPAKSSDAEPKKAGTMLDAVKAALKPTEASPTSKTPGSDPAQADPKTDDEPKDGEEPSEEEVKHWSARTKNRFKKLSSDLKAKDERIQQLEPRAQEFEKVETFIQRSGLTADDVSGILQIGALTISDPRAAYERLVPVMAQLEQRIGEVLPKDLKERVDAGYLTEEDARALSRSRSNEQHAVQQRDALERQRQSDTVRQQQQQAVDKTCSAVEAWEKQQAASDPDWHLKRDEVNEQVELAVERKTRELNKPYFPTPEEALKLAKDAADKVSKRIKRFGAAPKEIKPVNNAGASNRSKPEPKNMLEMIKQTVNVA